MNPIEVVVAYGVKLVEATLRTGYLSVGGIPRDKTRTQQRDEEIRLQTIADVLDRLHWYGEWGQTNHGIKLELIRRAKETV